MIKWSFFKRRKPRELTYVPRYYDPEKEELEKRIREAENEVLIEKGEEGIRREINFRKAAREQWSMDLRAQAVKRNLRFALSLLGILILILVLIWKYKDLGTFFTPGVNG